MVRFFEWPWIYFSEATVEDRKSGINCLKESEIEDLVRGKLSEDAERRCLVHLLWCQSCQHQVNEEDEFARATRSAAVLLQRKEKAAAERRPRAGRLGRVFDWISNAFGAPLHARWAAAALSVCALTFVAFMLPLWRVSEVNEVLLRSERGSTAPATAESVVGGHLRLRIDVADVVPYASYSVTVVDAVGETLETISVNPAAGSANVTLQRQLPPGSYWVRLAAPDGRLLREYALRIRP